MMRKSSRFLFERAKRLIPGGVNSPVRAFGSVGLSPFFVKKASGSKIYDVEGNEYIDYVASWGPLIHGHAHPEIVKAIHRAARKGTSYGAPTELEVQMAEMIIQAFPSIEMVRLVSSGTEAVMSAIRLARGYTNKDKIIKFEGCYHGHADSLLVKAGSGVATLGIPGSPGIPEKLAELTLTVPFNDLTAVEETVALHGKDIACLILEPVPGNMGVVLPHPGFLEGLRRITKKHGILLIFDEVITGFRLTWGGYQNIIGIEPDLTCLGKIIGGGLPVGAFGGRKSIMEALAPTGPVYQAGTLSGNPLALSAGMTTLKILRNRSPYEELERKTSHLCSAAKDLFDKHGVPVTLNRIGSMFTLFFSTHDVHDFRSAKRSDTALFARFFRSLLENKISIAPSQFEVAFVSTVHTDDDLEITLQALDRTLENL